MERETGHEFLVSVYIVCLHIAETRGGHWESCSISLVLVPQRHRWTWTKICNLQALRLQGFPDAGIQTQVLIREHQGPSLHSLNHKAFALFYIFVTLNLGLLAHVYGGQRTTYVSLFSPTNLWNLSSQVRNSSSLARKVLALNGKFLILLVVF